eukprot:PhF_6_TR21888/c0_g1_i2/m.31083
MSGDVRCIKCKGINVIIDEDEGFIYCEDCGVIVGEVTSNTEDSSKFHSGSRVDFQNDEEADLSSAVNTNDASAVHANKRESVKITKAATSLGLGGDVGHQARKYYLQFMEERRRNTERGGGFKGDIMAACLMAASMEKHHVVTVPEVVQVLGIGATNVAQAAKRIMKVREALERSIRDRERGSTTTAEPTMTTTANTEYITMAQEYQGLMSRGLIVLRVPGAHTCTIASAMCCAYESRFSSGKDRGLVCGAVLHMILTNPKLIEASGLLAKSVVPIGSKNEDVILDRIAKHYGKEDGKGRLREMIEVFQKAEVKEALLIAAMEAFKKE